MSEAELHGWLCWLQIALAAVTVVAVVFVKAPYGRHFREGWGPSVPSRVGWIVMEMPAVALFIYLCSIGDHGMETVPLVLLGIWQIHYVHRTLIFPFRMRAKGKRMPVLVVVMAFVFQLLNVYINARWISHFGHYANDWLTDPRFLIGVAVFVTGLVINLHADTVLLNLRKPGETGYKVPKGGLYRWVSCPNYFGEILEWTGWAIATWSLAGLAFMLYTIANVGPRAFANHRWYRETFDDYPDRRRALIPFVA